MKLCSNPQLNDVDVSRFQELVEDKTVNVNFGSDALFNNQTPLMALCSSPKFNSLHFRCAKLLLQREDIDVNVRDRHGLTALLLFCSGGATGFFDFNKRNHRTKGLVEIVQLLLVRGADLLNVNAALYGTTNDHLPNALFALVAGFVDGQPHPESLAVVRLLIDNGINVNVIGLEGSTILHVLCKNFKYSKTLVELVRLLIEKGLDRNLKDVSGLMASDHWYLKNLTSCSKEEKLLNSEMLYLLI